MPSSMLAEDLHLSLEIFLERNPLPWLRYSKEERCFIMVVDNHLLSTHRSCPAAFMIAHVEGYQPKTGFGIPNDRRWYLDFGIVFHNMIELYYKHFRDDDFKVIEWATEQSWIAWSKMNLDGIYSKHPEYHSIGGFKGFVGMLLQYAHRFTPENEKLRILGTEIAFGKDREVCLYDSPTLKIYLAGRMDVIVDDGYFIMPMDHKTVGRFGTGDILDRFIIDEGPTGYIYTLKKILPKYTPMEHILKRDCSRILMNIIAKQITVSDPMARFKRLAILKTEAQLAAFEQRMIGSCFDLLTNLGRFARHENVPRDTSHCTDWYHGRCAYFDIHRQSDSAGEQATLSNGFTKLPIWDTEAISLSNGS